MYEVVLRIFKAIKYRQVPGFAGVVSVAMDDKQNQIFLTINDQNYRITVEKVEGANY